MEGYSRINNACLVILAAIAITSALIFTRNILVPFVISVFAYSALAPMVSWMESKLRLQRIIAICLTLFLFLIFSVLIVFLIVTSLDQFIQSAHIYKERILDSVQRISEFASNNNLHIDASTLKEELRELPVFSIAKSLTGGVMSVVGKTTLVIIFTLFLVLGKKSEGSKNSLMSDIQTKVSSYVMTKSLISVATGLLFGLALLICQVELALMFCILTILFNFIPNIGSLLAILLPLPIIILQYGFGWQFWFFLSSTAIIQFVLGNVIEPKLMGDSMDLHPITILIFLMFWGLIWGIPGMFMAVPITAVLRIVLSRIETTRGFANILAGRMNEGI